MELTPKEKASELLEKFSPLVTTWDCYWDYPRNEDDVLNDAKQCALIAVDEILYALNDDDLYIQGETNIHDSIEYYNEVKQEINNL